MRARRSNTLTAVLAALGCAFVAAAGCSNTVQGTLNLITGPDDGFAATPKPTSLQFELFNVTTGDAAIIATASLPADAGVSLPAEDPNAIDIVGVTGFDQKGDAVVSGATVPVQLGELSGATLNLFVQRTGQFSRLPSGDAGGTAILAKAPSALPLLTDYAEFLMISDGTGKSAATQVYDTFAWGVAGGAPVLPIAPLSVAYVDTWTGTDAATEAGSISAILTLGSQGKAYWLDLTDSTSVDAEVTSEASAPTNGGSFADVAGGQSILDLDDSSIFIVGATRTTGEPTRWILHVNVNGVMSWNELAIARLGATAAYVKGAGLYVFGGNTAVDAGDGGGGGAPGAELVQINTSMAMTFPLPTDTTTGAGAAALDSTHVLVAGGVTASGKGGPVRLYDTQNLTNDAGAPKTFTLPVTFVTAQVFALTGVNGSGNFDAIVIGSEASGATSAYRLSSSSATLLPFRVPRSHARGVILPNGTLGVVGGGTTMESFIP